MREAVRAIGEGAPAPRLTERERRLLEVCRRCGGAILILERDWEAARALEWEGLVMLGEREGWEGQVRRMKVEGEGVRS